MLGLLSLLLFGGWIYLIVKLGKWLKWHWSWKGVALAIFVGISPFYDYVLMMPYLNYLRAKEGKDVIYRYTDADTILVTKRGMPGKSLVESVLVDQVLVAGGKTYIGAPYADKILVGKLRFSERLLTVKQGDGTWRETPYRFSRHEKSSTECQKYFLLGGEKYHGTYAEKELLSKYCVVAQPVSTFESEVEEVTGSGVVYPFTLKQENLRYTYDYYRITQRSSGEVIAEDVGNYFWESWLCIISKSHCKTGFPSQARPYMGAGFALKAIYEQPK